MIELGREQKSIKNKMILKGDGKAGEENRESSFRISE